MSGASHVAKGVGWALGCVLAPALLGAMFGPRWIAVGAVVAIIATMWLQLWLPRAAHAQFTAGRFGRAGRRYRLLAALAFTAARDRAAALSRIACAVAADHHEHAMSLLSDLDPDALTTVERAVYLNNRACLALSTHDSASALALADEAIGLRPDVPAIQHTRARALLAAGRTDDAIGVLDAMRAGGELTPYLEVERCRDLALAWERKGQFDYAADYRERARIVIPSLR